MLQIISGKFFRSANRNAFEAYGILYSNVALWTSVQTSVATIHPVDTHGSVARYVITYTNQIESEDQDGKGFALVRTGDAQIIEQLSLLAGFGLRGFFSPSRSEVEHVCRARRAMAGDWAPSQLVDRFCDSRISAETHDIKRFTTLVDATIGLRRKTYVAVMEYLRNFFAALRAVDENLDLAYSMLVYGLEALSQEFGEFEPTWDGVEEKVRDRIDTILAGNRTLLTEVREALLLSTPTRTQARLVAFIENWLPDSFFLDPKLKARKLPLRYSELARAVRNAYQLRSSFVHKLESGKQLKGFEDLDVITRTNQPHFSFRGLAWIAEGVVRHFIDGQEKVASEDVDWQSALPGIITAEMAPQYWVWRVDGFEPQHTRRRLSAFLWQVEAAQGVTVLHDLLSLIAGHILKPRGSVEDRRAMAALYLLYHAIVQTEQKPSDDVVRMSEDLLKHPCIESVLMTLLLDRPWEFSIGELEQAIEDYQKQKFRKWGLTLSAQMEAAVLAYAGNQRLESGEHETARAWLRRAMLELVGQPEKQKHIKKCGESGVAVDLALLAKPWSGESEAESPKPA